MFVWWFMQLGSPVQIGKIRSSSDISNPTDVMNWLWLFMIVSNESSIGIYVGSLLFILFIPNSLTRVSIQYFPHTTITLLAALCAGTKTQLACNLWRVSLTSGWSRTLHLGDLKCPFKFEMWSVTNSFNWSFHSERYLSSTCSLLDQFLHRDQWIPKTLFL